MLFSFLPKLEVEWEDEAFLDDFFDEDFSEDEDEAEETTTDHSRGDEFAEEGKSMFGKAMKGFTREVRYLNLCLFWLMTK